jgi:hypothetical protein
MRYGFRRHRRPQATGAFLENRSSWAKTSPGEIRSALTDGEIDASDRRVKFVTLLAYENAGGTVRRDLFTNGDDGIFIDNVELLNKLAADRIEETTAMLLAEGWKWVEFLPERGYEERGKFKRFESAEGPLPADLQAEYDKLSTEHKKLGVKRNPSEADEERFWEIEDRIRELDRERPEVFKPEQIAIGGVFLEIQHDGELDIQRGYVKPDDAKAAKSASPETKDAKARPTDKAGFSQSLQRDLHAHRTAATAALLMENPKIALSAVVHSLAIDCLYDNRFGKSIDIGITGAHWPEGFCQSGNSLAIDAIAESRKDWKKRLPPKQKDFWQWCLDADQKTLLSLLAFLAALSDNFTEELPIALGLDMNVWFTPTARNFFGRIRKGDILKAIKEATGKPVAPATEKMKKSDLATFAERTVKATSWLPKMLRAPADRAAKTSAKRRPELLPPDGPSSPAGRHFTRVQAREKNSDCPERAGWGGFLFCLCNKEDQHAAPVPHDLIPDRPEPLPVCGFNEPETLSRQNLPRSGERRAGKPGVLPSPIGHLSAPLLLHRKRPVRHLVPEHQLRLPKAEVPKADEHPLCYAQIGGLAVATFITLLLVPVFYSIFVLDLKWIKWEATANRNEAPEAEPQQRRANI